jgi:hypothetical protein
MRQLLRPLALSMALLCSVPVLAEQLTVGAVKAFSAKIDAAVSRRDTNAVLEQIAPFAQISGSVSAQGQTQPFRMDKSQYREALRAGWAMASSYTYKRSNEKIALEGNQAVVTADIAETMVIGGQQISSRAYERATVEVIDGKLMVTKIFVNQVQ